MNPARQLLTDYVLEHCVQEPLQLRLSLYRALAADLPEASPDFNHLTSMADDLEEEVERHQLKLFELGQRHQQLVLDFKRRTNGGQG